MKHVLFALIFLASLPCYAAGNTLQGKLSVNATDEVTGPAVIYVTGFSGTKPGKEPEVLQKDEKFEPSFVPVVQGQSIRFVNRDEKSHNIFSNSETRKFDLGTTDPGTESKILFPKPGLVDIFCNIHPSMQMRVLVLQNPAFTLVESGKTYKITGIPDGKFKVFAWHPRGRPVSKEVEFKGGKSVTLDWSVDAAATTEPHLNKYGRPYRDKKSY